MGPLWNGRACITISTWPARKLRHREKPKWPPVYCHLLPGLESRHANSWPSLGPLCLVAVPSLCEQHMMQKYLHYKGRRGKGGCPKLRVSSWPGGRVFCTARTWEYSPQCLWVPTGSNDQEAYKHPPTIYSCCRQLCQKFQKEQKFSKL